jgi:4-amino-4-deoxy-L-arabinose transferase-like glycosyltransferase
MSNHFGNFREYLNNGKNFKKIIILLVIFLCITKLPALFSTDIQPWDEGMYALRVLSIHENGDFLDQSSHSVGGFYSAAHPPLLIWIGWIFTSIFGMDAWVFKIIPFIFSLLCIIYIIKIGKLNFNIETGIYAALIFSTTIVFNIFSKRFQFDIPYTFLIILSFYFFLLYLKGNNRKYLIITGVLFGACLMIKILVGFFIPMILGIFLILNRNEKDFTLKDLLLITSIGILIAFPWHFYIILKHGNSFIEYFLNFHLYQRALTGVEHNVKQAGIFYYVKYLLAILPVGILFFLAFIDDIKNIKQIKKEKISLWIWSLTGFLIISLFKTKLESYILMMLAPACLIISNYAVETSTKADAKSRGIKFLFLILIILNIGWYLIQGDLIFLKHLLNDFIYPGVGIFILFCLAAFFFAEKINLRSFLISVIIVFFFGANIYYSIKIPYWENSFKIEEVKNSIVTEGRKKIVYIGSDFRYNPQFSFYFKGIDLGWKSSGDTPEYQYTFLDTKDGIENVKDKLSSLDKNEYNIIVESDIINRSEYPDPSTFIPEDFRFIMHSTGYSLYYN